MKRPRGKLKEQVKNYLENNELARERTNRYRALQHFLLNIYPEFELLSKETRIRLVDTCVNADRMFRKV